jgi:hypothetical protein
VKELSYRGELRGSREAFLTEFRALLHGYGPPDRRAEQELIVGSELRVINDVLGHLSLFGTAPTFMPQIDRNLGDLLVTRCDATPKASRTTNQRLET